MNIKMLDTDVPGTASVPELDGISSKGGLAAADAGMAAARFGALRPMAKKEQERYISDLLDQWEARLDPTV